MVLCKFGCGLEGIFKLNTGYCCSNHHSKCPALRKKSSDKLKDGYKSRTRKLVNYNELPDETKLKMAMMRGKRFYSIDEVLSEYSTFAMSKVRQVILENQLLDYKCNNCGIFEWNNIRLGLELDHINGYNLDNRLENLRFLCPNCHSQTETFRGRNKNTGQKTVDDSVIIENFAKTKNIRKTLILSGLAAKGANYNKVKRILTENNIEYKLYDYSESK